MSGDESNASVQEAHLLRGDASVFRYEEKSSPTSSNLDLLTYGHYRLAPSGSSDAIAHPDQEALLFCLDGNPEVELGEDRYALGHYDTLYVPRGAAYRFRNPVDAEALLVVCRAPAATTHPVVHSSWEKIRADETRIRHLDKKDVFLMFDVTESADHLIAGYTIFEPHARSWPPHNHTDQEEVYIFTRGRGAMEVYASEEEKTFVHSVDELDAVTIPLLNYHPVFSHDEELHFIWCIAGERYWVGDKNSDFMDGSVDRLTT
ncbi:5-keto-4-deoxyuronate isomerase [Planctomycetes bacterium Pan216]|uniref:5-keto-4-deoxyuronate isomerase n=1 Tax=Kolteria novifilia TaxID=2527975 RepID=A0A518BBF0_9BACT|nr:5-keto-4-deoxyuronate isomerase [Planctomycetes bacterium Pan216]